VLVLSSDAYNASASPLVGIVPLTSAPPKNPLHVSLSVRETGLTKDSTVLVDHLRFVDRERLASEPAGNVREEALERIEAMVKRVLALR
jgi:mRNA-degrading endonuclease toxin of MazEF toxin-antitoxin module